ncbi:hypothetical protein Pint_28511 [Pistacia integerrima]|uniref:Uncharacterized protein n=1 Tax=Pistacia integerrima TaxID=434235 RepID=A0ACC0YSI4_9ROSI|nr:hypothetical protein Pint_28511 [Pistacia integerrima]
MVLKKLISSIYNLIIPRGVPRSKAAPSYEVIASGVREKAEGGASSSSSLAGASLAEDSECESCCVCLSGLKEGEDCRVLPCLHEFHRACINRWFNACSKTCPICRFSMKEDENFHFREEFTEEMVIWFSSFHVAGF